MTELIVETETVIPITIDYLEEDQVYQISCPWLQGCHSWGETLDEAMRDIPGNIRAMIAARIEKGSPLHPNLTGIALDQPFTLRIIPA